MSAASKFLKESGVVGRALSIWLHTMPSLNKIDLSFDQDTTSGLGLLPQAVSLRLLQQLLQHHEQVAEAVKSSHRIHDPWRCLADALRLQPPAQRLELAWPHRDVVLRGVLRGTKPLADEELSQLWCRWACTRLRPVSVAVHVGCPQAGGRAFDEPWCVLVGGQVLQQGHL